MTKEQIDEPRYKRIAVIGGGPTGLAAVKALSLEPVNFSCIDLFERRDRLGGLWYHHGDKSLVKPEIPSLSPSQEEIVSYNATPADEYFSAIYEYMETNIVHQIMEYSGVAFPANSKKYPTRSQVLEYIDDYIKLIPKDTVNISINSNVVSLEKVNEIWHIEIEDVIKKTRAKLRYDAVIIANGHFSNPYIPDVPGLSSWNKNYPGTITHSKYYESPAKFRDKRVLVVGNSASGVDISIQLSVCAKDVFVSIRDQESPHFEDGFCKHIGLIEEYNYETRSVRTTDREVVSDIDYVIFCTGYLYALPFLKQERNITDGFQVYDLYKQIFNIYDPSLTFLALLRDVIPMPISESQAALIARVYSGRYKLPPTEEMERYYQLELKEKGRGGKFHNYKYPRDVAYCQMLQTLIDEQGLHTPGLVAPIWDESLIKKRSETRAEKNARLKNVVEHVKRLRAEGKDFSLLE